MGACRFCTRHERFKQWRTNPLIVACLIWAAFRISVASVAEHRRSITVLRPPGLAVVIRKVSSKEETLLILASSDASNSTALIRMFSI